jgi:tRNA pseudouridine38-40 synthase
MKEASLHFVGTHDFEAFKSIGSSAKTTIRTIKGVDVGKKGDIITLQVAGDGFLYNMVRIIAGTLLAVGSGKIMADEITKIIDGKDRNRAGSVLPARGLCLEEVYY